LKIETNDLLDFGTYAKIRRAEVVLAEAEPEDLSGNRLVQLLWWFEVRNRGRGGEAHGPAPTNMWVVNARSAAWREGEALEIGFDSDARMGPKNPTSRVLNQDQEAIILAYRWGTRLALNDCHERLRRLFPKLSRSALYRCLKRRDYSRIGRTEPCPPLTERNQRGPYTFEITFNEVGFHDDHFLGEAVFVFLAVEEVTKHLYAEVAGPTPENAAAFLARLAAEFPQRIIAVTTDIHPIFTDWRASFDEDMAAVGPHPFAVACRTNRIAHRRTVSRKLPDLKIRSSTAVEIQAPFA
jgi:hypothetical protein